MGLDVYLYLEPLGTRESEKAKAKEYSDKSEALWSKMSKGRKYGDIPEAEREECRKACAKLTGKLGLNEDGDSLLKETIQIDSELYPDHMFKIGYFRSSYNGAGTNAIFRKLGIPELQKLFSLEDEYYLEPDWQKCLENTEDAIVKFKEFLETDVAKYNVEVCNCFSFIDKNDSTQNTMDIFMKNLKDHPKGQRPRSFSSQEGFFFLDGMKILGFRPVQGIAGLTMHLIVESDMKEGGTTYDWYLQALEIVKETCDWVLKQDNPEDYTMRWSG